LVQEVVGRQIFVIIAISIVISIEYHSMCPD